MRPPELGEREPEERVAADRADSPDLDLTAGRVRLDLIGGKRDDNLAADLTEQRQGVVLELEGRSNATPERGLGERDGEPPSETSWTSEAEPATRAACLTSATSETRSSDGEPPIELQRACASDPAKVSGERDRASRMASPSRQRPGTRRTSGTSPTHPTTGVGWIDRPSVSL